MIVQKIVLKFSVVYFLQGVAVFVSTMFHTVVVARRRLKSERL
jgi:hypothetical protein